MSLIYPVQDNNRTICQVKTPIYLMEMGVAIMRQYFSTEDRITLEYKKFMWETDQAKSEIYINDRLNFDVKTVGKRPAISVALGEQKSPKIVMQDLGGVDLVTGAQQKIRPQIGQWIFNCLGESNLGSYGVAVEAKYFWESYNLAIGYEYDMKIEYLAISPVQKSQEYEPLYNTQVMVSYEFVEAWILKQEALPFKTLAIKVQPD